jgi:hypothetical protein
MLCLYSPFPNSVLFPFLHNRACFLPWSVPSLASALLFSLIFSDHTFDDRWLDHY